MRAALNPICICLVFASHLGTGGCAAHRPGSDGEPPKLAAMVSLLHSLRDRQAGDGERCWYEAMIAPARGDHAHITYAFEKGYGHRLEWSEDTIERADAATVVATVMKAERITGVDVTVYYWHDRRWISGADLAKELHPLESAAIEAIAERWLSTRPVTRPAKK